MRREKPDVILIAYYFPPSPAIGAARPHRFYKYLKRAGYRCHVITASGQDSGAPPDVHYIPDEAAPLWEAARVWPLPFKALVELVVRKYFVPAGRGIAWSVEAARRCRTILRRNRDRRFVLIASYPPEGVLLAALLASFLERIPWIADFRDPLVCLGASRSPFANPTVSRLRALTFRTARAIVANTQPMADLWAKTFPRVRPKLHVIWNGFDPEEQPAARDIPERSDRLLTHAGELYVGRNPNVVLQSLARLRETDPEARRVRVALVGQVRSNSGLDQDLCDRAAREAWLDLRSTTIPKPDARRLTEEADLLLLLQPQSAIQVPGKLFEYICIGRPIAALVPRSSAVEYILANAGVPYACIYSDDDAAVQDRKLRDILRCSSSPAAFSAWFAEHFDARYQSGQLASIIQSLVADSSDITS